MTARHPRERLIHYSHEPLVAVQSVDQATKLSGLRDLSKPVGLWFATDEGWAAFCKTIKRPLGEPYEVVLKADARILRIATANALDAFTAEFGGRHPAFSDLPPEPEAMPAYAMLHQVLDGMMIDWPEVAKRWQGIIISPWIAGRHNHELTEWYYGWDCASGCVWDAEAVLSIKRLKLTPKKRAAVRKLAKRS